MARKTAAPAPKPLDLATFMHLAEEYSSLGWAVHDQFKDVVRHGDLEEQNEKALEKISEFLRTLALYGIKDAQDIHEEITDYLKGA